MHKNPIVKLNHQHLQVLFHRISPEFLFEELGNVKSIGKKPNLSVNDCSSNVYHRFAMDMDFAFSDTEVRNMSLDLQQKLRSQEGGSIFHFLLSQGEEMLSMEGNYPLCRFEYVLAWREISKNLGQDLFTCSFLAARDLNFDVNRKDFCWKAVLSTDHKHLKNLLSKGISENHFHLNGSVPIHTLSWVYLMNHPSKITSLFRDTTVTKNFSEDLLGESQGNGSEWREKMKTQIWHATALRAELFQRLFHSENFHFSVENQLFTAKRKNELKSQIEMLRFTKGLSILQPNRKEYVLDYALHRGALSSFGNHHNRIYVGERYLLYSYFKRIFSGKATYLEENYFYYYLLLQNSFYSQMVQVNKRLGFENFTKYQDRKDMFFSDAPPYDTEAKRVGIFGALQEQNIHSLEARITFKNTAKEQKAAIEKIDHIYNFAEEIAKKSEKSACFLRDTVALREKQLVSAELALESKDYPYYYVLHFIKKQKSEDDTPQNSTRYVKPRNFSTRKEIYRQARAFQQVMEKYPEVRGRFRGIDACSQEIGCRPEVFATEFRYLRENSKLFFPQKLWQKSISTDIHVTFHAGEDFLDLLDGLRAIDETVRFLEYTRGDRLGHALALGVMPDDYYALKQYRVILPKQDLLDNLVWFFYRSQEYGIEFPLNMSETLKSEGRKLLCSLYDSRKVNSSDLEHYYHSMKLRGDHPDVCMEDHSSKCFSGVASYDKFKLQKNKELERLRTFPRVSEFLKQYHFCSNTRKKGNQLTTWEIPPDWIPYITLLQEKMQLDLTYNEIAIECNPSSNVLIGTLNDYEKHPVFRFFNVGIERLNENLPSRMMDVSLNTDDLGVFATSLENEYAMIACALQKEQVSGEKLAPGFIYEYLERLRYMGINQSFHQF